MAITLEYTVTNEKAAVNQTRYLTDQILTLTHVSDFNYVDRSNRSIAWAMDEQSFAGTFVAESERVTFKATFPINRIVHYREMVRSAKDYQRMIFDATEIHQVRRVVDFVLLGDQWPQDTRGCTHIEIVLEGAILDR